MYEEYCSNHEKALRLLVELNKIPAVRAFLLVSAPNTAHPSPSAAEPPSGYSHQIPRQALELAPGSSCQDSAQLL